MPTFAPVQRRPKYVKYLPCVFCGRRVPASSRAAPDAFAVCGDDDARLDAALVALTAEVLSLLDRRRARP